VFGRIDKSSFFSLIEAHISDLKKQGKIGYARTFQDAYNAVKRFAKKKDFELSTLDRNWGKRFTKYMRGQERIVKKQGKTITVKGVKNNTISIYLRNVRRIYNIAKEKNLVKEDIKFKIPSNSTDKKAISKKDMLKIINASDIADDWIDTHNYIVFSYLAGGMNFMDIAYLQWDKNIDGNYIQYVRKKTEGKENVTKLKVKIRPEIPASQSGWPLGGSFALRQRNNPTPAITTPAMLPVVCWSPKPGSLPRPITSASSEVAKNTIPIMSMIIAVVLLVFMSPSFHFVVIYCQ